MKRGTATTSVGDVESCIKTVRGQKVILDTDLARIYGVPTKRLNEQLRRNIDRFPEDFAFQITLQEWEPLRSQIATLEAQVSRDEAVMPNRSQFATGSQRHRDPRFLPLVFTEHGALQAANILNSPRAAAMSVYVIRAFVKMRGMLTGTGELARQLKELENKLTARLDIHESAIVDVLQRIMRLLEPPPEPEATEPERKQIGFHIKEDSVRYRIRRRR